MTLATRPSTPFHPAQVQPRARGYGQRADPPLSFSVVYKEREQVSCGCTSSSPCAFDREKGSFCFITSPSPGFFCTSGDMTVKYVNNSRKSLLYDPHLAAPVPAQLSQALRPSTTSVRSHRALGNSQRRVAYSDFSSIVLMIVYYIWLGRR
jgi:hypothetical protein